MAVTPVVTDRWIKGRRKHTLGTLEVVGQTYFTGGALMPTNARNLFGFVREIDYIEITGPGPGATESYVLQVTCPVKANDLMKLVAFEEENPVAGGPLPEVGNGTSLTDGTYQFHAVGW